MKLDALNLFRWLVCLFFEMIENHHLSLLPNLLYHLCTVNETNEFQTKTLSKLLFLTNTTYCWLISNSISLARQAHQKKKKKHKFIPMLVCTTVSHIFQICQKYKNSRKVFIWTVNDWTTKLKLTAKWTISLSIYTNGAGILHCTKAFCCRKICFFFSSQIYTLNCLYFLSLIWGIANTIALFMFIRLAQRLKTARNHFYSRTRIINFNSFVYF